MKDELHKISKNKSLNLDSIAVKIDSIVANINENNKPQENKDEKKQVVIEKNSEKTKQTPQAPVGEKKANSARDKGVSNYGGLDSIREKLKGSDVSQQNLNDYLSKDNTLKSSIDLYLEFWKKVKEKPPQKDTFDELLSKVKQDNILKKSELRNFLESICKNSSTFEKSYVQKHSAIRHTNKITLNKLKEELNKK
jgi:hypothetical protein